MLFLLSGEPGIGKTRLAEELGVYARSQGASVLWGRCWEGDGAPAFWPWAQVIRELAERLTPAELAALMKNGAAYVTQLVPELGDALRSVPAPSTSPDSPHARFYAFDETTRFLKRAARSKPLVLMLDDLHWADKPSLLLLEFVARELQDAPMLVIGTYRDAEAREPGALAEALSALARLGRPLPLRGLGESEVARFMASIGRAVPDARLVAAVHGATGGNPFFVNEIVRLLLAEGIAAPTGASLPIPETVRAVVRRRLALLPEESRQLLAVGSVVGREFEVSVIERVARISTADLADALARATAAGLVTRRPDSRERYRFLHALIRETLYEDLPRADRRSLHRGVGEALEDLYRADLDSHIPELAHHFLEQDTIAEIEKAIDYATRAGRRAMATHGYEEAAGHFTRALEAQEKKPDEALRCELLLSLGEAESRTADLSRARNTLQRAARLARSLANPEQLSRAALACVRPFGLGVSSDRELLEEALEMLPEEDSPLRARLTIQLATELHYAGDPERSGALAADVLQLARRLGDRSTLVQALRARHGTLNHFANVEERLTLVTEALRLAEEIGDKELICEAHVPRIRDLMTLGNIGEASSELEGFARRAGALRQPFLLSILDGIRAGLALFQGRFDDAEKHILHGIEQSSRAGGGMPQSFQGQFFTLRKDQGRLDEVVGAIAAADELFRDRVSITWRCARAAAYAEGGRHTEARREFESLAEQNFTDIPRVGLWILAIANLAEVCAALADSPRAATLHRMLLPYSGQIVAVGFAAVFYGAVDHHLGRLAATMSRYDDAKEHFENALTLQTTVGARPWTARTRFHYAEMLLRRGDAGDGEKAATLLDGALADAEEIGMRKLAADIRALKASSSLPSSDAGSPEAPPAAKNLLRRDGAYWTIGWEGKAFLLKDTKGLRFLAALLAEPGREFHALDLAAANDELPAVVAAANAAIRPDLGDAGAILDAEAKAQYRRRLEDLRADLEEAERFNDTGRATRNREEIEFLTEELARATGLGGRDRKAASAAERARANVTMAIRAALKRIAEQSPSLGHHLAATVRTGKFCSYTPDPRLTISWRVGLQP